MTVAAELPQAFNHSFDVDPTTAMACADGAVFTGEPIAASSLNILMTGEVWDAGGANLLATGDTHTFTAIGEQYTFTVPGTFTVGSTIVLQASDIPGTFPSTEGDAVTATVADCSIAPGFGKSFAPNPIDPGDVSTLTFSIENSIGAAVGNLDFSDRLPANVVIATPANAATTCTGGALSAPAGGDTIAYSGGTVGASSTCTVSVGVTSNTPGTYMNTSSDLTSDAGTSGSASDDLVVNPIAVPTVPGAGLLLFAFLLLAGGGVLAARRSSAPSFRGGTLAVVLLAAGVAATVAAPPAAATEASPPGFSKAFMPDTIGPGSTTMLIFTINNSDNPTYPVGDLAFDDELPFGLELAEPAFVSNDCGGIVTTDDDDADSAFDIRLVGGMVAAGASCTIVVNVTGSVASVVPYTNISFDLTSDAGNSGTATAGLTITDTLPGFTKVFDPAMVPFGGRSTLTFTIDNTDNGSDIVQQSFTDTLPPGMVVADPANASTNCGDPLIPAELTADPGTSVVDFFSAGVGGFPSLEAGMICTVVVDVVGGGVGALGNVSGELSATIGGGAQSAGKAAAVLEVDGFTSLLALEKTFTDDPVPPGGTVTLEFTARNLSRDEAATGITFSDTIDPMGSLTGVTPTLPPNPDPPCGAGSSLSFAGGALTLTGGSLPAEGSCIFSVTLSIPPGAMPGTYTNTTGTISGDVGGSAETGDGATDQLFVVAAPILTKEFTDDPVGAGGTATLEFTITNTASSGITDIEFFDTLAGGSGPLMGFLPFPVTVGLPPVPNPPCNGSSSVALVGNEFDGQGLQLTGGELAASDGMPGGMDTCSFTVTVDIPEGFPGGTYTNTTGPISAEVGMATVVGKSAKGDIVVVGAPQLSKLVLDDPVAPGGTATVEFTLSHDDLAPGVATSIAFTDDLTPIAGVTATAVGPNSCTGSTVDISTPTKISFSGGSLAPGEECAFSVTLSVDSAAAPGLKTNTTSEVTATVTGVATVGAKAQDQFLISGFQILKEFTDDPVIAGDTATLQFTLDNTLGTTAASSISFDDDLDAVLEGLVAVAPLPVMPCGGTLSGTGDLSFDGGSVPAMDTCSFSVTVMVPATIPNPAAPPASIPTPDDVYINSTDTEFAVLGTTFVLPDPAIDGLEVDSTLLEITKEFLGDPVSPGGSVTLKFTLTNLSTTETVTDIAFSDDLDAALSGLEATGPGLNGCGGMATSGFPTGLFTYAGGMLDPDMSCTITLAVDVPDAPLADAPPFINTTSGVTGKVGMLDVYGDPDEDELLVQVLAISKDFTDDPTTAAGTVTLEFTLTNLGAATATDLSFLDNLSAVIPGLVATTLPPVGICGSGSMLTGTSTLSFTGGSLAGDSSCVIPVTLTVPASATAGTYLNATSALREQSLVVAPGATASLEIEPPPTFAKVFAPDSIGQGQTSTLTFTIDNSASAVAASSLAFTDALPAGVAVTIPSVTSNTCGGTLTAVAGTTSISLSGGSVAASGSCQIMVSVTGVAVGAHLNTTSDLTSTSGNSGTASDILTVNPQPAFSKMFAPDPILVGGTSTLTFTIANTASTVAATGLDFTDNLPAAITVAAPPNASTTCTGGTLTAAAGSAVITYSGGSVVAGASCTVVVDVTSSTPGTHVNTSGDLTSSLGNSGTATDTLTVNPPPGFSKVFAPDSIGQGQTSTLTFTIDNSASTVAASSLTFTDTLPAGVAVSTPTVTSNTCGGTLTAVAGTTSISLSGGSVAASGTCQIMVSVTGVAVGAHLNTTGDLTSSSGNSGTASDTLTVNPQPAFSKMFAPDPILVGGTSTLTFTIANTASTVAASSLDFTDNLPAAITVAAPPNASTTCTGGTLTAAAGSGVISYSGGSVVAGASCTVVVDVTSSTPGTHSNTSGDLTSSLGNSGTASDTLTVNPPPGFAKSFATNPIDVGATSTLTFSIDNTGSTVAATSLDFIDNLPAAIVVASPPNAATTCTGGTLNAVAGSGVISYTGGSVAAGTSCTVSVDVTSSTAGMHTNTSGDLTSSLGNSGTSSDTLTVEAIPPVFTKSFSPDPVVETQITTLTFTIDNTASLVAATDLDFLDLLPFDLQVAPKPMVVNSCGGTITAAAGSTSIGLSNGSVGAGATCTISVEILAPTPRVVTNTTGDLTSSAGNSGTASDMLTVVACPAPDGADLTLENQVILAAETREACNTISVLEHVQVLGPNGKLTLRAGVAVVIFNGFSVEQEGSELTIVIDPSLTMP